MRAVTVEVSESGGLAGLLAPGSRVDVLLTTLAQNPEKTAARTVVQNVAVLAVGQRLGPHKIDNEKDSGPTRTVTLLTSPHDAEALELASAVRPLRLALRGTGDTADTESDGIQLSELRGGGSEYLAPIQVVPQPATQPVIPSPQPPASQPVIVSLPRPEPRHHKTVRVIQGTEERRVVFEEADPAPARETVTEIEKKETITQ
jgi:pilus assembly protein CpaB